MYSALILSNEKLRLLFSIKIVSMYSSYPNFKFAIFLLFNFLTTFFFQTEIKFLIELISKKYFLSLDISESYLNLSNYTPTASLEFLFPKSEIE